jgi:hypothetical protein
MLLGFAHHLVLKETPAFQELDVPPSGERKRTQLLKRVLHTLPPENKNRSSSKNVMLFSEYEKMDEVKKPGNSNL